MGKKSPPALVSRPSSQYHALGRRIVEYGYVKKKRQVEEDIKKSFEQPAMQGLKIDKQYEEVKKLEYTASEAFTDEVGAEIMYSQYAVALDKAGFKEEAARIRLVAADEARHKKIVDNLLIKLQAVKTGYTQLG